MEFSEEQIPGYQQRHGGVHTIADPGRRKFPALTRELLANNAIRKVGLSSMRMPGWIGTSTPYKAEDVNADEEVNKSMKIMAVDYDFIPLIEAQILTGRNFSREFPADSTSSIIINELAAAQLGWKDVVGKWVEIGVNGKRYTVAGLVKDLHCSAGIEKVLVFFDTLASFKSMKKIEEVLPDALRPFGFECTTGTDGVVTNYYFKRKNQNRYEMITIFSRKRAIDILNYSLKMHMPRLCIAFPAVENLMSEAEGESPDKFYTIAKDVSKQVAESGIQGLVMDNFEVAVNTESEIEAYANLLVEVYNKYALDFYARFAELQRVDDYLTEYTKDEKRLIANAGNTALHRIIIIKYLCNNPTAAQYHAAVKNEFEQKIDNATIKSMNDLLLKIEKKLPGC